MKENEGRGIKRRKGKRDGKKRWGEKENNEGEYEEIEGKIA